MINTIRCCISCILPCGAFDVIRIVHTNGYVEELSGTVFADQIMKLHPKHVLKKPSSSSPYDGSSNIYPQVVIIPPEAQLQRGKIYFLMPVASTSVKNNRRGSARKKMKKEAEKVDVNDHYLAEILSEKVVATQNIDRRRGRGGVWRPHLESISETPILYES